MHRIQFGEAESFGAVVLRGAVGGETRFTVPRFGDDCVCCNAPARGRTKRYDPSTDRIEATPFPVPVCLDCDRHALQTPTTAILQACLLVVGGCLLGLGVHYLGVRPHDRFLVGVVAAGAIMLLGGLAWIAANRRRDGRARLAGHHPGMAFSVGHGRTILDTSNDALADDLLARNPSAKRAPTPLLWRRREARRIPAARVVKTPPDDPPR